MADKPANVLTRYVGDDWTAGPVTLVAGGQPVDLTGAEVTALLYVRDQIAPVLTLTETELPDVGGLAVAADRTAGVLTEAWVAAAVTAEVPPQDRRDATFFTRLAVRVRDSRGRERTHFIVLFQPLDRRSDVPPA